MFESYDVGSKVGLIDAHQHFWDLDKIYYPWLNDGDAPEHRYGDHGPIRHTFLPEDYRRETKGFDIDGTVHVEALAAKEYAVAETQWLAEVRAQTGLPTVAVAQVRLETKAAHNVLRAQKKFSFVRGIRCLLNGTASRGLTGSARKQVVHNDIWQHNFSLLEELEFSCDLFGPYEYLPDVARLAAKYPGVQIVLNHAGNPHDRSRKGINEWKEGLEKVARERNVAVKLSGIGVRVNRWRKTEVVPVLETVLDLFGAERCMFASNFPPDRLLARFDEIYETYYEFAQSLSTQEREQLFSATARKVYAMDDAMGK